MVDLTNDGRSEQGNLNVKAGFDQLVVWDHETTSDASGDPYVRGMEEWLSLAEQVRIFSRLKDFANKADSRL